MGRTTENHFQPRIYVACLAAYNSGYLHGKWIDADQEAEEIIADIQDMLAESPISDAEEWAIHDYEDFGEFQIREYMTAETIADIAVFLKEHGELGSAVADHLGADLDDARTVLTDHYLGCYDRLSDYVAEITEGTVQIPPSLIHYIDYEAMARDAEINGDIFSLRVAGDLHVFAGC